MKTLGIFVVAALAVAAFAVPVQPEPFRPSPRANRLLRLETAQEAFLSPPPVREAELAHTTAAATRGTPRTTATTARKVPPTTVPAPAPAHSGLPAGLLCLRHRESHDNYLTNTGNGYYGAYQYDVGTWAGYGGYRRASDAPPAVQDVKALAGYNAGPASRHRLWPKTSRACGV